MTQDATKGIRKKKLISMEVCKAVLKYMDILRSILANGEDCQFERNCNVDEN